MLITTLWIFKLILLSGDVQINPGPSSCDDDASVTSTPFDLSHHLSFVHYNVQSIFPKLELLYTELAHFDILAFSETWLSSSVSDNDLNFESYHPPERKDRKLNAYGGVILYIKENLSYTRRKDLEILDIENIWVEISLPHNKKVLFGLFYRPPNSSQTNDIAIEQSIDLALNTGLENIFITGDFNLNTSVPSSDRKLQSLCNQFGLTQCIDQPTHFTEHSSSIIDLLLVNNENALLHSGVGDPFLDQNKRYHCPIYGLAKFNKPKVHPVKRHVWIFDKGDYNGLRNKVRTTDWDQFYNVDIDIWVQNFTNYLLEVSKQFIPNRIVNIKTHEPRWLTSELKRLIRKRKRLYRKAKSSNSQVDWDKFRKLRNDIISKIKQSKIHHIEKMANTLITNCHSKSWWKVIKSFMSHTPKSSIPPIKVDSKLLYDDVEKADAFNDFFAAQTHLNVLNLNDPEPPKYETQSNLADIDIIPDDLWQIMKSLPVGKAVGPDLVNNRILKELAQELSTPLCKIFNTSIATGKFPTAWKQAHVSPIFKKENNSIVSNYRPISLLSTISKVFERAVYKYLYNHMHTNSILTEFQSGFIPQDSTQNQLTFLYNSFCNAIDSGKEIRVVFCDISKAFDRVWHKGIIIKLKSIGIKDRVLEWFESYLSNRQQTVVLNGVKSSSKYIHAGVPQGSILGPILFLIYINDIVRDIRANIRLFADDTSLSIIVNNIIESADVLNKDLDQINNWANKWLVTFNPGKTKSMIVSKKVNKPIHPPLLMNNHQIEEINEHKHLGLLLSNDCSWHAHINYMINKAWKRINILQKLKFTLDRKSLETIYTSFIRPILEYGDVIFDNCTKYEKEELEKVQIEAARIVTGTTKLISINKLYNEIGWQTLQERRDTHKLVMLYKIQNNLSPSYLREIIPQRDPDLRYNLRYSDSIPPIACRTSAYYNSFFPSTIRAWNALPTNIQQAPSLQTFKHLINNTNRPTPIPAYYSTGPRNLQIHHARLRTGSSSLNAHLHSKNIVPSAACTCGETETTQHFLFECPIYTNQRDRLFSLLIALDIDIIFNEEILLFGSSQLSYEDNKGIFLAVYAYIDETKRFK